VVVKYLEREQYNTFLSVNKQFYLYFQSFPCSIERKIKLLILQNESRYTESESKDIYFNISKFFKKKGENIELKEKNEKFMYIIKEKFEKTMKNCNISDNFNFIELFQRLRYIKIEKFNLENSFNLKINFHINYNNFLFNFVSKTYFTNTVKNIEIFYIDSSEFLNIFYYTWTSGYQNPNL
jgi:hypothetical protein